MHIAFYAADKDRERAIGDALAEGARTFGDTVEVRSAAEYGETFRAKGVDVGCTFGVKGKSRQILDEHLAAGKSTLFFDKGYTRMKGGEAGHTLYSRISVNAPNPLAYFQREPRPHNRMERLNLEFMPLRKAGGHIVYCSSSAKYHTFVGLPNPNDVARELFMQIRRRSDRHLIYRPKPSWHGAEPIKGASLSHDRSTLGDALRGCHCVITHGSTAAAEAVIAGVPAIVLGDSIARPVSETDYANVEDPFWPTDEQRMQWAADMAYTQWTFDEMRSGEAWQELRHEIERQKAAEDAQP